MLDENSHIYAVFNAQEKRKAKNEELERVRIRLINFYANLSRDTGYEEGVRHQFAWDSYELTTLYGINLDESDVLKRLREKFRGIIQQQNSTKK